MFMVIVTLAFNLLLDTKTAHGILGDVYCGGLYTQEDICKGSIQNHYHGAGWHFSFMHWFIVFVNIFILILRAVHLYIWYNNKSEK
jgi:hypothetical protein